MGVVANPFAGCFLAKIGPGEMHISTDPDEAISTVLGSCVAACMRDPVARVGGMNHFMLPESGPRQGENGAWGGDAGRLRYGSFAMAALIEGIQKMGGRRERLEVKLFGAARLGRDLGMVGENNARFALAFLAKLGLHPLAQDLGGIWARRLAYHPATGRAFMVQLRDRPESPDAISQVAFAARRVACPSRS